MGNLTAMRSILSPPQLPEVLALSSGQAATLLLHPLSKGGKGNEGDRWILKPGGWRWLCP